MGVPQLYVDGAGLGFSDIVHSNPKISVVMKEDVVPSALLLDGPSIAAEFRPALVRFFTRRTGNVVDAEDLTQDVLVRALTHSNWTSSEQAKGYIFRSAINRLRDRHRRFKTQGMTLDCNEVFLHERLCSHGSQNPLECVLIAQEELSAIDQALQKLNVRTRTVFVLIKLERLRTTEVADMLGISVRAVNKHVQKAMSLLAQAPTCVPPP